MKDFIKMTFAAILGFFLVGVVFFFFSIAIIGSLAAIGNSQPVMPDNAVLSIDMSTMTISEQTREADPISQIQGQSISVIGILDAIRAIDAAAQDPSISYIFMKPDMASGGIAEIEELRCALENFRNSGKAVISYMETPTNAGYYLASVSDKIYMSSHEGTMSFMNGLSSQMIFLKDILDKLGVNVQLIRHGKYKSAGEMYIRNSASKENIEQNQEMIDAVWGNWTAVIAASRGISQDQFNSIIDNLQLNDSEDFLEHNLVDELLTLDQLQQKVNELHSANTEEKAPMVGLADYAKLKVLPNFKASQKIAVIYADGNIIDGKEPEQVAGDRFAKIISTVRKDSSVKAVVFRVSSPGGSVFASEKIRSEMELLRQDKPVVASYGNYAASGGYWISAESDYIFSNAGTLTGSIGVFSMMYDLSGTMKNLAHVNVTSIKSNRHSDMYSGMRPLDNAELAYMQASVEGIYDRFTDIVAEGRNMRKSYVDSIAQGRVWAGSDALRIGLVDRIGTIKDALEYAASIADTESSSDLSEWQIAEYPKPLTTVEKIMETINGNKATVFKGTCLENVEKAFRDIKNDQNGKIFARIPYEINIK